MLLAFTISCPKMLASSSTNENEDKLQQIHYLTAKLVKIREAAWLLSPGHNIPYRDHHLHQKLGFESWNLQMSQHLHHLHGHEPKSNMMECNVSRDMSVHLCCCF